MLKPDNEAEKIYFTIFNKHVPASIQNHFRNISKTIDDGYEKTEVEKYYRCIAEVDDLEALEVITRYFHKLPILTDKFKVMVYLAETLPENYDLFINQRPDRFIAYMSIVSSVFRTLYKVTKGMFLLVTHKI